MLFLSKDEALEQLAELSNTWIVYASWSEYDQEILQAAPWLDRDWLLHGEVVLQFENEEAASEIYNQTVGDDGPTETNQYCGKSRVYAELISPDDGVVTENT